MYVCMYVCMCTFLHLFVMPVCTCLHCIPRQRPNADASQQAKKLAQDGSTISSGYSRELGKLGLVEVGDQAR